MDTSPLRRKARVVDALAGLAAFGWPFLFLFPYVIPAGGSFLVVGNDFHILYYNYKTHLLDSLSRFDIPWWSPSEAAGFPFYASPFSETFYPLNLALAVFYRLAGGWNRSIISAMRCWASRSSRWACFAGCAH